MQDKTDYIIDSNVCRGKNVK